MNNHSFFQQLKTDDRQQNKVQNKQTSRNPENRVDALSFILHNLNQTVEDKPSRDAIGNTIT
ncbi:hypothetical protein SDC9_173093 [bioreactor metagenome]|uniref:Uncharacterized protein n=1 Tax=bioreactor metagenome TaxID=1076179 RepID=A0A645GFH7_9ZZZZ